MTLREAAMVAAQGRTCPTAPRCGHKECVAICGLRTALASEEGAGRGGARKCPDCGSLRFDRGGAAALDEAREVGFRQGVEAAAKVADEWGVRWDRGGNPHRAEACEVCAQSIRALPPPSPSTPAPAPATGETLCEHGAPVYYGGGCGRSCPVNGHILYRRPPAPAPVEEPRVERVFWSVSSDEEHFTGDFDTKEEAIAAAPGELGLLPGDRFWIGKGSLYKVTALRVDDLFERMSEDAGEECGEVAEDWQPAPDETCEAEVLAAVMRCLERRKDVPSFWCVHDIECHRAPVESSTDGKGGGK